MKILFRSSQTFLNFFELWSSKHHYCNEFNDLLEKLRPIVTNCRPIKPSHGYFFIELTEIEKSTFELLYFCALEEIQKWDEISYGNS